MTSSKHSIASIASLGTFSGGQSLIPFTKRYSLSTTIELDPGELSARFYSTLGSAEDEAVFFVERYGSDAVKRYLGCALLFALPAKGVDEAFQSLKDVFEYYQEISLLPGRTAITAHSTGKGVGSQLRPTIDIED